MATEERITAVPESNFHEAREDLGQWGELYLRPR